MLGQTDAMMIKDQGTALVSGSQFPTFARSMVATARFTSRGAPGSREVLIQVSLAGGDTKYATVTIEVTGTQPPPSFQVVRTSCAGVLGNALTSGSFLMPGNQIRSPNNRYQLVFQTDGNLVLYDTNFSMPSVVWAANTYDRGGARALMNADGSLQVQMGNGLVLWSTYRYSTGSVVSVQDDSDLVVFQRNSCTPVWSRR